MFGKIPGLIMGSGTIGHIGKIENVVGISVEASSGRSSIGDIILTYNEEQSQQMPAEMVGFKDGRIQLMTYEVISGITPSSFMHNTRRCPKMPAGDFFKGRIINAMRRPIDGRNIFRADQYYTVSNPYTSPLDGPPIHDRLGFGAKVVNGLNTIGKGQRIGIFTGPDVGKSTSTDMVAKNVKTDTNVTILAGERGREVLGSVQKDLGEEGMKRSALVVATPDQPATLRMKCPLVATTIAEYFRDQGFDVLPVMDSLIRYAMAQREIGLAIGEPPIARGYTPSIYAGFPRLLERSGNFSQGSITEVYTALVEGDDTNEPITDTVRGILDGHIVSSRQLANENHFPATDIGANISRLMVEIVDGERRRIPSRFRNTLSLYQKDSDLISIGAYKKGANTALDGVIFKINKMNTFLQQGADEQSSYEETLGFMEPTVE